MGVSDSDVFNKQQNVLLSGVDIMLESVHLHVRAQERGSRNRQVGHRKPVGVYKTNNTGTEADNQAGLQEGEQGDSLK